MVTDKQVKLLRRLRRSGKSQEAAAARADMAVKTARKWEKSALLPSQSKKPRHWRTRRDPFEEVWEDEIVPRLQNDKEEILEAATLFDFLQRKFVGSFQDGQLRTLQRRIRDWRALHGAPKEVFFPQEHPPGREGQLDFTHCDELKVTIASEPFPHLIFQFILSHSGHRCVSLAGSETFEALSEGIQNAVWSLGGTPKVWRSDNLSAATHQLKEEGGRELTERYAGLISHYGVDSTRITPGNSHENGLVEKNHDVLKGALRQELALRMSSDFPTVEGYWSLVLTVVAKLNRRKKEAFERELPHLLSLPSSPVPAYTDLERTVSRYSCIRINKQTYSVPSRLIGYKVTVRLHPSAVEVLYRRHSVEKFPRLKGDGRRRIDYRHISHSLVMKPGAFARYKFREELFPTLAFRRAYDMLTSWRGERADVDYVRILHLAASTMEQDVEAALEVLLDSGDRFDYRDVKALVQPEKPALVETISRLQPDLAAFDELLKGASYDDESNNLACAS
jgi:transposase